MAQISLHVNGEQRFSKGISEGECLSVNLHSEIGDPPFRSTFARDCVFLHGSIEDMRRFAHGILDALPKAEPVESDESYEASAALQRAVNPAVQA